jgi:hypothetical protein
MQQRTCGKLWQKTVPGIGFIMAIALTLTIALRATEIIEISDDDNYQSPMQPHRLVN